MTSLGYRTALDGPIIVTQTVQNGAGFQQAAVFDWSDWGITGDTRYAFLVWGRAGNQQWTGGPIPTAAQVEVALGIPGKIQPSPNHIARLFAVNYPNYIATPQGTPFAFLVVIDTANTDFGVPAITSWTPGDDVAIYARTNTQSTSPAGSNSFELADMTFMAISLDRLDAEGIEWGYWQDNTQRTAAISSETPARMGSGQSVPDPTLPYVHFGHCRYRPQIPAVTQLNAVPHFQLATDPNASPAYGTSTVELGTHRWGRERMTASGAPFDSEFFDMAFMPFAAAAGVNQRTAMYCQDKHTSSGSRTIVESTRCLSINMSKFAFYRERKYPRYPTNPTQGITGALNDFTKFVPFEIQVDSGADYTSMYQHFVQHFGGAGFLRSFTPHAYTDTSVRQLRVTRLHDGVVGFDVGVPSFCMVPELISGDPGNLSESRYQFHPWDPNSSGAEEWPLVDVCILGFYLDSEETAVGNPPVTPQAPIILVPGKEALDTASLLALPYDPEFSEEIELDLTLVEMVTATGYRWSRPAMTDTGRVFRWSWSGMKRDERDTLRDFLASQNTFKRTLPKDSAPTAFAAITRLDWRPQGILYTASGTFAELINVGA